MNQIFKPRGYITVPDGTDVSAFLNATDESQKDVPWGILQDMSIASGRIKPGIDSWIHMHPVVTQVTYLISGLLDVRMKDDREKKPYDLSLKEGEAVLVEPGTLFQLRNRSDRVASVLYLVSPTYVFEMVDKEVIYDDAYLVAKTWEELEEADYNVSALKVSKSEAIALRSESFSRIEARKTGLNQI